MAAPPAPASVPGPPGPYGPAGGPYGPGGTYGAYAPYAVDTPPPAPNNGVVPLRPLSVGEMLDGAVSAIRWNPKAILLTSAVVGTLVGVVQAVGGFFLERDFRTSITIGSGAGTVSSSQAFQAWLSEIVIGAVEGLISVLGGAIVISVVATVIGHGLLGRKKAPGSIWRVARSRIGPAIAAKVLTIVFVVGGWAVATGLSVGAGVLLGAGMHLLVLGVLVAVIGSMAASVFAVVMWIRWQLAVPAVVLERASPMKSLGRSWTLVQRSWWRVFWILVLTELVVELVSLLIRAPFLAGGGVIIAEQSASTGGLVGGVALMSVGVIIASMLFSPVSAGVTVLLYTDLRMRREGLDITLRASSSTGTPDPSVTGPSGQEPAGW